ncbi:hypothetical protein CXF65_14870, partial [Psychrobacter sp. Sarcosine-3u-12]
TICASSYARLNWWLRKSYYYSTVLNTIVAKGESVLVYLDKTSGKKKNIDDTKKAAITAFESFN